MRAVAACGLALTLLVAGTAQAGSGGGNSLAGTAIETCGKWVLKLRDFGKLKLGNYDFYVPPIYQTPGPETASITFVFQATTFAAFIGFPDQMGAAQAFVVNGSYRQRGNKVNFQPDSVGVVSLATVFADLSENYLFGDPQRQLVVSIPFAEITNPDDLRFKGRVKKNGRRLKVKFKAKMLYDIQFENNSDQPDIFNAKGRFKLRMDSDKCPAAPMS